VSSLCWAGNHIVGRAIAQEVPPVPPWGLNAWRWLLSTAILLPFAWRHLRVDLPVLVQRPWVTVMLAATGGGIFGTLQFVGLQYTTALNVALMNSVVPAFIIVTGMLLFGERVGRLQAIGVATSFAGVITIITAGDPFKLAAFQLNPGDLIVLANMVLFAGYSVCLRLRPKIHWLTFITVMAVVACLANVPFAIVEAVVGRPFIPTLSALFALFYTAMFSSTVAYVCFNRGVMAIGSQRAGVFLHLVPIFGAVLAMLVLGEWLHPFHAVGFALIIAGVTLAVKRQATPATT
jgi:drug/metabolite transporter (DMT)-like permease